MIVFNSDGHNVGSLINSDFINVHHVQFDVKIILSNHSDARDSDSRMIFVLMVICMVEPMKKKVLC